MRISESKKIEKENQILKVLACEIKVSTPKLAELITNSTEKIGNISRNLDDLVNNNLIKYEICIGPSCEKNSCYNITTKPKKKKRKRKKSYKKTRHPKCYKLNLDNFSTFSHIMDRLNVSIDELEYKLFLIFLHSGDINNIKIILQDSDLDYLSNPEIIDILVKDMIDKGWINVWNKYIYIKGFKEYQYAEQLKRDVDFIRSISLPLPNIISNLKTIKKWDEYTVITYWATLMVKAWVLLSAFRKFYYMIDSTDEYYSDKTAVTDKEFCLANLIELIIYYSRNYFDPKNALDIALLPTKENEELAKHFGENITKLNPKYLTDFYAKYYHDIYGRGMDIGLDGLKRVLVNRVGILTETFSHLIYDRNIPVQWVRFDLEESPTVGLPPFEFFILYQLDDPEYGYEDSIDRILKGYPAQTPLGISIWKLLTKEEEKLKKKLLKYYWDNFRFKII